MKLVIASGYFIILHIGHIRYLQAAKKLGDKLVVIANNDDQQLAKKGQILVEESHRLEIISALGCVDEAFLSIDKDRSVCKSIEQILASHEWDEAIFANGGDKRCEADIPEVATCSTLGAKMIFGVGSYVKCDSTSDIVDRIRNS